MPGSQHVHLPKRETGIRWRDEAEEVIEIVGRFIEGSFSTICESTFPISFA